MNEKSHNLVLERMQRLLCLGLEGTPASEVIEGTSRVWLQHLAHRDSERLEIAFDSIEQTCKRWPSISHILHAFHEVRVRKYLDAADTKPALSPEEEARRFEVASEWLRKIADVLKSPAQPAKPAEPSEFPEQRLAA